jgi:hypothetical protein
MTADELRARALSATFADESNDWQRGYSVELVVPNTDRQAWAEVLGAMFVDVVPDTDPPLAFNFFATDAFVLADTDTTMIRAWSSGAPLEPKEATQ